MFKTISLVAVGFAVGYVVRCRLTGCEAPSLEAGARDDSDPILETTESAMRSVFAFAGDLLAPGGTAPDGCGCGG